MKLFSRLVLASLFLVTAAEATSLRARELPLLRGQLVPREASATYPRATVLTQNQNTLADEPTSFTLVEDTGIRCIVAPCPSQRVTQFKIQAIVPSLHNGDVVRYEAYEVLKNIPPNVRIAPRRLVVVESSMELVAPGGSGFMRRLSWEVEISRLDGEVQLYQASPKAIRR